MNHWSKALISYQLFLTKYREVCRESLNSVCFQSWYVQPPSQSHLNKELFLAGGFEALEMGLSVWMLSRVDSGLVHPMAESLNPRRPYCVSSSPEAITASVSM